MKDGINDAMTAINPISLAMIVQLFALLNPLYSFPVLIEAYKKKMNVPKIAIKAVVVAFFVAMVLLLLGPLMLVMFDIRFEHFRTAGGIVLTLLGITMVRPKDDRISVGNLNAIVTIIATPLLTGPATISFITIKAREVGTISVLANLCIAFILVALIFMMFSVLINKINPMVVEIMSRVMGLFLTAVGIEMVSEGILGIIQMSR
jgi:multiple antibiotic resistance protein